MASQIDSIYHNGALLNYIYPYSRFINVLGTQEILRLACQTKLKPVIIYLVLLLLSHLLITERG